MKIKISFIVPVFNVESYLQKCLESLINQSLEEIEIIVVNDGSTDNSLDIIEKYRVIDKRIRVINKINGGLSDARNVGIKVANGEYIAFVDSDDWIEVDLAEKVYSKLISTKSDMCIFGIKYIYSDGKEVKKDFYPKQNNVLTNIETLKLLFLGREFQCHAVDKVCKTSIVKKYEYPLGRIFEDIATTYKFIYESKRICFLEDKFYNYLIARPNSILNSKFNDKNLYIFDILNQISVFLKTNKIDKYLYKYFFTFNLQNTIFIINKFCIDYNDNNVKEFKFLKDKIKNLKFKSIIISELSLLKKVELLLVKFNFKLYINIFSKIKN